MRGIVALVGVAVLLLMGCHSDVDPASDQSPTAVTSEEPGEEDANASIAAAVPWTDIWLLPLGEVLAGNDQPGAKNITRRRGYDNQPAFSADGKKIFYASIRDEQQSDVFVYEIATDSARQLTDTPESEYSPTPRGAGFSTVQVAMDGTQRLWLYDAAGTPMRSVREDITGVGYHAWLGSDRIALFIVDEPLRLVVADVDGEGIATVATDIGRSLHALPDGRLAYVHKAADDDWSVRAYDAQSAADVRLAATLPAMEDLAWLADGSALMANGRGVHRLAAGQSEWTLLVELAYDIHGDIGRMAVDPTGNWLAVVVTQNENK